MKKLITAYTFNASANASASPKTITFSDFTGSTLKLERILLITNVTRNIILYNFASLGGTVLNNILTLSSSFNATTMDANDKLQIFYDYPEGQALSSESSPVVLPAAQITALTPPTSVGLSAGGNTIGAISNTAFSINGTLPAFATSPTVNIGTAPAGLAYLASTTPTINRINPSSNPYTASTPNFDVYGTRFELQNIGASGGFIFLSSLDIVFSSLTALPAGMGAFAVYLYSSLPTSNIADNSAFSINSDDRNILLTPNGILLTASLARGGGLVVAEATNLNQLFKLTTSSLHGYLVTLGAFTPTLTSETLTIRARSFAP